MSNQPEQPPKRRVLSILWRIVILIITFVLVLGAVLIVVNYDELNIDAVKRYLTYRSIERSDTGQAASFPYARGASTQFVSVGSDLLVCSDNTILLYSGSGTQYISETVTLLDPIIDSAGDIGLIYDAGGTILRTYSDRTLGLSITQDDDHPILAASINESGWVALCTQDSGYKGSVTVYDNNGSPIMEVSLSSQFVMDALISPDCKSLAILTVGLTDGIFDSQIAIYSLTEDTQGDSTPITTSLGDEVILDSRWSDDGIWCLGENEVFLLDPDGSITTQTQYTDLYLKTYSIQGDGFAAMLLGKYRAGTSAELTVLNESGDLKLLAVEEQILSLSASGSYLAVLTADRLDIYNPDLTLYNTLEGTQGAREVVMRDDGTALLIDTQTAHLYIP